jgi:SAM-dependent methyltransferase
MMDEHDDTIERLIPDEIAKGTTGEEALRLHLDRYEFAARCVRGRRALDIACGSGYGTRLLADRCASVESFVGVDQSRETIAYATERYGNPRIRFVADDAMTFDDGLGFDTIVSLETIEHLPDPRAFIGHIVTLLRPGGVLVASVPTTPSVDANPHHLHDFTARSFRRLFFRHGLKERDRLTQIQRFGPWAVLSRSETRMRDMRPDLAAYYLRHPGSFARRICATMRYGFTNRYLTVAWDAAG